MHHSRTLSLISLAVLLLGMVLTPAAASAPETAVPAGLSGGEWASIQDQIRLAEYHLTWQTVAGQDPAYRAPNRGQGFAVALRADGAAVTGRGRDGAAWRFGLALRGYGETPLPAALGREDLRAEEARVTYRWSESVEEWYVNGPRGLEHGLTLHAPPEDDRGEVRLAFALDTDLAPELSGDGQALLLRDAAGRVVLRYDGLRVGDASGRRLDARLGLGAGELVIAIAAAGATYPVTVDPLLHSETAILHASDAEAGDHFGLRVAISGDTLVVGAPYKDVVTDDTYENAGAAYIFSRDQSGTGSWGEVYKLTALDPGKGNLFGHAVAISGDMIVVGALAPRDWGVAYNWGKAYIFERNWGGADNWGQVKTLVPADPLPDHGTFGAAVAIDGDTIVVGAPSKSSEGEPSILVGAAYVFDRDEGGVDNWGQVAKLNASNAGNLDSFGTAVSINGDTIVVGATREEGGEGDPLYYAGAAYVFERNMGGDDNWGEVKILRASNAAAGDMFGASVSVGEDTIVVGAYGKACEARYYYWAGAAYVFGRDAGGPDNWGEVKILCITDGRDGDGFGYGAMVDDDIIVIGAYGKNGGEDGSLSDSGAAYVFGRNVGGTDQWGQVAKLTASDAARGDRFGFGVAISGSTLIVGADYEDGGEGDPYTDAGAVYVYELSGTPDAPSTPILTAASDTGVSDSDGITNDPTPTFTGTGEEGATVALFHDLDDDGAVDPGEALGTGVPISGTWSITTTALADGTYNVKAIQSDLLGQVSAASGGVVIVVDTTPPALSIGAPSTGVTSGAPVTYTLTYSGAYAVQLAADDVILQATGTAGATVGVSGGTTAHPVVTLSDITGEGTLAIGVAAGTAADVAGNLAGAAGPGAVCTVEADYAIYLPLVVWNAAQVGGSFVVTDLSVRDR